MILYQITPLLCVTTQRQVFEKTIDAPNVSRNKEQRVTYRNQQQQQQQQITWNKRRPVRRLHTVDSTDSSTIIVEEAGNARECSIYYQV